MQNNFILSLSYKFLLLYCLFSALSIAGSQICLGGVLVTSLYYFFRNKDEVFNLINKDENLIKISKIIMLFFIVMIISLFFGLRPLNSAREIIKFGIFFLIPYSIYIIYFILFKKEERLPKTKQIIYFIFFSHSLAAIHTIISTFLGYEIKPRLPGPLSESGQFELIFPILFSFPYIFLNQKKGKEIFALIVPIGIIFIGILIFSWHQKININYYISSMIAVTSFIIAYFLCKFSLRRFLNESKNNLFYLIIFFSLSFSAFILNLKRGPWFAVLIEFIFLSALVSKRIFISGFTLGVGLIFFSPIYDRLSSMSEHFFIAGGRFDMWKLGFELIERFPLGIGFSNSDLIRVFDPSLPLRHRHMHNNILNIILETGILGGLFYIFIFITIYTVLKSSIRQFGFSSIWSKLSLVIVTSLFGWQLAGVAEYNFGDGEVRLMALLLLGLLFVSLKESETT